MKTFRDLIIEGLMVTTNGEEYNVAKDNVVIEFDGYKDCDHFYWNEDEQDVFFLCNDTELETSVHKKVFTVWQTTEIK